MEECLSLPELFKTLDAIRDKEHRSTRTLFATVGVDIDEDNEDAPKEKTAQDIYNEAMNETYGYDVELAEMGIVFSDQL